MPDRVIELYERNAHAFDAARRGGFIERPWLERLAIAMPRRARILDLGCGAGEPIARFLIDQGFQITGVDSSAAMIGLCRVRFARHQWLHLDMRKVAFDAKFSGVVAWDSLFHLDAYAQERMLARIAHWLEPRGRLLFNSGPARGEAFGELGGEPLFHASLSPGGYREIFAEHALEEVAFKPADPATGGRTVWLVRKRG